MYVYIQIHIRMYTHTYIHTYTHIYLDIHTCIGICIYVYSHPGVDRIPGFSKTKRAFSKSIDRIWQMKLSRSRQKVENPKNADSFYGVKNHGIFQQTKTPFYLLQDGYTCIGIDTYIQIALYTHARGYVSVRTCPRHALQGSVQTRGLYSLCSRQRTVVESFRYYSSTRSSGTPMQITKSAQQRPPTLKPESVAKTGLH